MTEIILYIAASLDGYIASPDGGVDWLSAVEVEGEDYGYEEFYESVDALLMGSKTYEQVLGFGEWPYTGKPCWVCTSRRLEQALPEVAFTASEPTRTLSELETRGLDRVWLVGGGRLAASFAKDKLISEYVISVAPILLGAGIPLFPSPSQKTDLVLSEAKPYPSGLVQLTYRPRKP